MTNSSIAKYKELVIAICILFVLGSHAFAQSNGGPSYGINVSNVTGTLQTANGGSGKAATLFSPETYKLSSDTDDTNSLQSAINAAQAVCGEVLLESKVYKISSALSFPAAATNCIKFGGASVPTVNWIVSSFYTYPYVYGTVIEQDTAATDVIDITAPALAFNFHDFAMSFGESIVFSNTGHGINATPPTLYSANSQGPSFYKMDNLMVFGHDGNHYAYNLVNAIGGTVGTINSFGGGMINFINYTSASDYPNNNVALQNGNTTIAHLYGDFFVNGSANCINFYNNQTQTTGSYSNIYNFGLVQCNKNSYSSINGHSITAPSASQQLLNGSVPDITINVLDLEEGGSATTVNWNSNTVGSYSWGLGGNMGYSLNDSNFGASIQSYEAGYNGSFGQRRHYTDLSTRLTTLESAGNVFNLVQDSALQGPTYATDGTRVTEFPDVITYAAGPSGMRWSSYTPPIGSTFFDTTVSELVTYTGSGWVNGAGSSVSAPGAGATSASDSFGRTASTLGQSTDGQYWVQYTANGSQGWATNGTAAYNTVGSNYAAEQDAWLFTHNYNGTYSVTLSTVGSGPRMIFRLSDRCNYWEITTTGLYKIVNCSASQVGSSWTAFTSGAVITAVLSGSSITIKNSGTTVGTATDTFNDTATGYGIAAYADTTSRFTSFSVVNP